jgi:ligand-binding sensor domain-containing protein/signal transduction histidine kinase
MRLALPLAVLIALGSVVRPAAQGPGAPALSSSAHHYLVDRWTVEDGLPNNSLSAVMSGRDGYLWVASLAGVWRFDGVRFTPIPVTLPSSHVRTLTEDRAGRLWIGTVGSGLLRANDDGRIELFARPQLAGSDVRVIVEDDAGRMWAATENGVSVIDGDSVTNLQTAQGLAGNNVSSLARGAGGVMWIATEAGICEARGLDVRCPSAGEPVPGRMLRGVVQESVVREGILLGDREGRLWIGGSAGVFSMGEDFAPVAPCARGCFVGRAATSLLETRQGQIIAGFAGGGVGVIDARRVVGTDAGATELYGAAEGMAAGPVVSLTEDAEGSVWVAIYNGGLERLRRKRLRMFTTADGLPAKVAGSIVQDRRGTIWAGSQCGPVSELVGDRFVPRFAEFTGSRCALSLLAARDGSLWIGTDDGLFRWADGRMTHFDRASGLSDLNIRALFQDRDGTIWIGTLFGGLHTYKDGVLSRGYGPADGVVEAQLESFAQDPDGRVWIGSNGNGLSVFAQGRFRILDASEQPPDRDVTGMYIDSRGDLWVSTDSAGMFRRRRDRPGAGFEPFGPNQGTGDSLIGLMLEDRASNMWIATTRGISRISRASIDAVADGRQRSLAPILLDRADGMLNPEVSGGGFDPTGLVDRDGRLWFSTIDGIAMIDPSTFAPNPVAPRVVIESATSSGTAVPLDGAALSLPAGGPPLELTYTGLSFIAPRKMQFRYRLAGFDHEWTEAGTRRTAYYPHLPPGAYTFEVLAANADGVWSPAPATLSVIVAPFWWERRSVQAAGLLLLLVAMGLAVRSLTLRRAAARLKELEREQQVDRERRRIAQDLHDDIGARLTQLALMADRGAGGDGDGQVAAAARDTIQAMDELVWTVNARNDTAEAIVNYCAAYAEDYLRGTGVRLRLKLPVSAPAVIVDAETRRQVFLCLKEALNNVVKHAHATEVHLEIAVTPVAFDLSLRDDGRGFDLAGADPTGNGLTGMAARARAARGRCEIVSAPGAGTRVHVHVPLGGGVS